MIHGTGTDPLNTSPLPKPLTTIIVLVLIFLIAGSIACYIRLYPLRVYVSNDAYDKASMLIMANALQSIRSKFDRQNLSVAGMSSVEKDQAATQQLNAALSRDKDQVRHAILQTARAIDQQQPPARSTPYLLASDSYYYYDLTHTIIQTGRLSNAIKGSKYFHPKMAAPDGYWEPITAHPYVGAIIHRVITAFKPDADLMTSVSWTPLVVTGLILIVFLITAAYLKTSPWASLIAAVYFLCANIFVKRSAFAWYDNDAYHVLFPMIFILILCLLFRARTARRQIASGAGLALALLMYTLFWQGWMFSAVVLAVCSGVLTIVMWKNHGPRHGRFLIITTAPLILFLAGFTAIFGWREIAVLFAEGWQALSGFLRTGVSVWPDIYIAVGELKKAPPRMIVDLTGGWVFLSIAAWGLVVELVRLFKRNVSDSTIIAITAGMFTAAALYMALGAQRFAILCIAPLALLFLIGIDHLIQFLITRAGLIKIPAMGIHAMLAIITAAMIIPKTLQTERAMPQLLDPLFNDTWFEALTTIHEQTPPEAIINSWWPPGHFIKAIADRRVTIDGATINNHQGYWLAHALLAATEDDALNYFRLLNNSGNQAVSILLAAGLSDAQAVALLKQIIHLPIDTARVRVRTVMADPQQTDALLAITHGDPPPAYFLLYNEMIENMLLFPFVARWNLEKAAQINQDPQLKKQIPSSHSAEYIPFLWSIAGGYPKISAIFPPSAHPNGRLIVQNHMVIDMNNKTCIMDSAQYGRGVPAFLIYEDTGSVIKKPLAGATLNYSVVVGQRYGKYQAMIMETPLAESLLVRLYFFGDTGLKQIRAFSRHANPTLQTQIDVFKIK